MNRLILLGPQPSFSTLGQALERLNCRNSVGLITAGWEEGEADDQSVVEAIPQPTINLRLFQRSEQLFQDDPQLIQLLRDRQDQLRLLRDVYRSRLSCLLQSARQTLSFGQDIEIDPERESAVEMVRLLDRQFFVRTSQIYDDYDKRIDLANRTQVVRHRREVQNRLRDVDALAIAGGHVGVIMNRLWIFEPLVSSPNLPVIAWSGAAMALAEQVVFFHDSPPQGPGDAEVFRAGDALYHKILPLPAAQQRLKLDDSLRVGLFARRFAGFQPVILDESTVLDRENGLWQTEGNPQILTAEGCLQEFKG